MTNFTTQKRAAKGGEIGANGEFYAGGKFINTVEENSKSLKVAKKNNSQTRSSPLRLGSATRRQNKHF